MIRYYKHTVLFCCTGKVIVNYGMVYIESWNHGMAWVGRDPKGNLVPIPLTWTGIPQVKCKNNDAIRLQFFKVFGLVLLYIKI